MIDFRDNVREAVVFGALLHDIGKMMHKDRYFIDNEFVKSDTYRMYGSYKHPFVSAFYIDALEKLSIVSNADIAKEVARCHHESYTKKGDGMHVDDVEDEDIRILAYLVSGADTASSKERRASGIETLNYRDKIIDNIFSYVNIEKGSSKKEKHQYKELSLENIFPDAESRQTNSRSLNTLVNSFMSESGSLSRSGSFKSFFTNLLYLLEKYTTYVPSDTTQTIADVSLYDHLKTTAALSLAGYDYHVQTGTLNLKDVKKLNTRKYMLITGTVKGIQKYIYAIESEKGAAKKLRSKSFYLSMVTDVLAHRIIDELDLTEANILLSAGSKFTIVAANTPETRSRIESLKNSIDDYMYRKFSGELYINIEQYECSGEETMNFHETIKKLDERLDKKKSARFADHIMKNPVHNYLDSEGELCPQCRKNHVGAVPSYLEGINICNSCKTENDIGAFLPKANYAAIVRGHVAGEKAISFFDDKAYSCVLSEDISSMERYMDRMLVLYDFERNREYSGIDARFPNFSRYIGNYVPKDAEGRTKEFGSIADSSCGVANIAALKMDVDNLGAIFYQGLVSDDPDEKNYTSISRVSTMSRMLEKFFSGYLSDSFQKNIKYCPIEELPEISTDFSNNYVVYSGGDDLLIIGPWNEIIYTAKFIRDKLVEFVSGNKDITISGGIAVAKKKTPVRHIIQDADDALDQSKRNGKNSLTVFGKTVLWDDFEEVFEYAEFFYRMMQEKTYSQSFIYRLLEYTQMMESFVETEDPSELIYISKFAYDLERNVIDRVAKKYSLKSTDFNQRAKLLQKPEIRRLTDIFNNEDIGGVPDEMDFAYKYTRLILNYAVRKNRETGR